MEHDFLQSEDILGPEGRIAARLQNYEHRMQQLEMADAVATALADKRHLVVEAGTGVGKSFAYLVPSILAATDPEHATVDVCSSKVQSPGWCRLTTHTSTPLICTLSRSPSREPRAQLRHDTVHDVVSSGMMNDFLTSRTSLPHGP